MNPTRPEAQPNPAPEKHVALNITKRCNQRCVFCFEGDRSEWIEPDGEEVRRIIAQAAGEFPRVVFMGAEALLRKDILEVIAFAKGQGLEVDVFTNGLALARDGFVEQLAQAGLDKLQVSFHHADAESYARATGVSPRSFERVLQGLRNVQDFNRKDPARRLPVHIETNCYVYNYGKLDRIVALLDETLQESFRHIRLGSICPDVTRTADNLLEPLRGRRDELTALLPSLVARTSVELSKMPLCMVPGWEHLSTDVRLRAFDVELASNFADKAELGDLNLIEEKYTSNPYFWVCRACNLVSLCPSLRTKWDNPSYLPTPEQKPIPERERTAEDVVARFTTLSPEVVANLARFADLARRVPCPERDFVDELERRSGGDVQVEDVCCDRTRLFDVAFRVDDVPIRAKISDIGQGQEIRHLARYLDVDFPTAGRGPRRPALERRVLGLLADLRPPDPAQWKGVDSALAASLERLSRAFGGALWRDLGGFGPWRLVDLRSETDRAFRARARHPAGPTVELSFRCGMSPVDGDGCAPLLGDDEVTVHLRTTGDDSDGPTLPLLADLVDGLAEALHPDGPATLSFFARLLLGLRRGCESDDFVEEVRGLHGVRIEGLDCRGSDGVVLHLSDRGGRFDLLLIDERHRPQGRLTARFGPPTTRTPGREGFVRFLVRMSRTVRPPT